jgi:hypothetical protein
MKIIFLVGVLMMSLQCTIAQVLPDSLIKTFFETYTIDKNKSIDNIYSTNTWSTRVKDGVDNIKKELNGLTVDYMGNYYGFELITKKQFSESFILYSYMVKYERQPLRFIFKFYKPNKKWILYSFAIDSNIDDEIEQAAKLYYLNLDNK